MQLGEADHEPFALDHGNARTRRVPSHGAAEHLSRLRRCRHKTVDRRMYEPCKRCGGKGITKTGKITVPCSGCGGAGGKNRTIKSQEDCRACGGKGYR